MAVADRPVGAPRRAEAEDTTR
ncbi:MAG: hypothetical protein QOF76_420, partial [Solirubrobacteraceae bacterium]|nr:hypothetical protein [Solirubrobacteraceae bacterium]